MQRSSRLHHSHLWLALSILRSIWSESPLAPWGNWKPQIIINNNSFVFLQPRIFETMWLSSSGVEEGAWKVWARTSHWPSVAENGVLFWTPLSQHEHYCWLSSPCHMVLNTVLKYCIEILCPQTHVRHQDIFLFSKLDNLNRTDVLAGLSSRTPHNSNNF